MLQDRLVETVESLVRHMELHARVEGGVPVSDHLRPRGLVVDGRDTFHPGAIHRSQKAEVNFGRDLLARRNIRLPSGGLASRVRNREGAR